MEDKKNRFEVVLLGIIFDPSEKKILIGRRENDPYMPELKWCFPGGRITVGNKVDEVLKQKIKLKTGYDVKNLGAVFYKIPKEKIDTLLVYFLCEIFDGEEKPGDDLVELKWVKPEELETYRKRPLNTRLKEYIMNLSGSAFEETSKK